MDANVPTTIPIQPAPWPVFPESMKPSNNSPYRTGLWFYKSVNNGIRILVEGRDKASVDAYAKLISEAMSK